MMNRTTLSSPLVALLMFLPTAASGAVIQTACESASGSSTYVLAFDTTKREGLIRYRNKSQDILYKVRINAIADGIIQGTATFAKSKTGETKGDPFRMRLNLKTFTLYDNDNPRKCDL